MSAAYATTLRVTTDDRPTVPIGWDALAAALREVQGGTEVLLFGGEPAQSPHLLRLVRGARDRGAAPVLVTGGAPLGALERIAALVDAGLAELAIAPDEPAPAERGPRTPFGRALRALEVAGQSGRLARSIAARGARGDPAAWVALAAGQGVALRVLREGIGLPDAAEDAWLAAAWLAACEAGIELRVTGWITPWGDAPPAAPAATAAGGLEVLVRAGFVPGPARAGVARADLRLARMLAGPGLPAHARPPCEGGLGMGDGAKGAGCQGCPADAACGGSAEPDPRPPPAWSALPPGARVAVLVPALEDKVQVLSTLPALVAALRARGLDAHLRSAWDLTFAVDDLRAPIHTPAWRGALWSLGSWWLGRRDPRQSYLPPRDRLGHPLRWNEPPHRVRAVVERFWDDLDLTGFDLVLAPGNDAARALAHPTLPRSARVVLIDDHMLEGLAGLAWDGRTSVHACFPGYTWLYDRAAVPLDRVHWRPYPLHLRHYAPDRPPAACEASFCGGWHHRDTATLREAASLLRGRPIDVLAEADPNLTSSGALRYRGTSSLPAFVDAVRGSRFVVLPLHYDPSRAAGITVLSMAFAAGRPVVASATPAMRDHLRHGVDGLLVPPGDARALADAIDRLDRDEALLDRLAAGARVAAGRHSVERWADDLALGAPARAVVADGGWRAW